MNAITIDATTVAAFALALVRASAWVMISPPFNTRMIPMVVKAGFAASLALAAVPILQDQPIPLETGPFTAALVVPALVGFALGFFTLVLVNALQAAGSLVDLFAGFSIASLLDPTNGNEAAVFGRFYQLVAITLLFSTNAYLVIINGWFLSFQVVPASGLRVEMVAEVLTTNIGHFFLAAIEIAAPVLACLFLAEIMMGVLSRAAPQLNVFSLAFPLRVIVSLIVVALAIPLLGPALGNLVQDAMAPLGG
jgi:flagellar biosynthesis protein FliR